MEEVSERTWKFPRAFWVANGVELLERMAYYATFIVLTLYLTDIVGFNDINAGWIGAFFMAGLYFLPPFSGAYADKIGFRRALLLAFGLLTMGYGSLGFFPHKTLVIPALALIMLGGSFIKSTITGTVAVTTNEKTRARGYSIFYMAVNIGAFSGKTFVPSIRQELGLVYINLFSAAMTLVAMIVVFFLYRNAIKSGEGKSLKEVWRGLVKLVQNFRLLILIFIVTGFWVIQTQLYATMPKYVIRTVGEQAKPAWIANVNPLVVVTFVVLITHLMRKVKAITSMTTGMFLMPIAAFIMSTSPILTKWGGNSIAIKPFGLSIISLHPVTLALIVGIIFQGLAECFISPRYYEYFSKQAPPGEEGLYLGFSHLYNFLSAIIGFGISGYLLTAYCPDPKTLTAAEKLTAYDNAHVMWYYWAAIGLVAGILLLIYNRVTKVIDRKKEGTTDIGGVPS